MQDIEKQQVASSTLLMRKKEGITKVFRIKESMSLTMINDSQHSSGSQG
jgi:hypothetical protein